MEIKEVDSFVQDALKVKEYDDAIEIITKYLYNNEDHAIQERLSAIDRQKKKKLKKIRLRYKALELTKKIKDRNEN